jgi:hypothetical protein
MKRILALTAAAIALLVPGAAAAQTTNQQTIDQTNTNFRSNITSIAPRVPGVSLRILDYNDELVLSNHSGRTVTVLGYQGEPYVRILADGTVQVNKASPAYYLNQNFYGIVAVPPSANAKFPPQWSTVDKTGVFQWHDHRIHWMSPVLPPQVKDKSKTTKIFDWRVPIEFGPQQVAVNGNLFWVGQPGGGFPAWALISLIVVVVAGIGTALVVQRRRIARDEADGPDAQGGGAVREAW